MSHVIKAVPLMLTGMLCWCAMVPMAALACDSGSGDAPKAKGRP